MSETPENDHLLEKTITLNNLLESEKAETIQSYIENNLTNNDILNMRFTSSQKSLLIKLVLIETNQFSSLFESIKKKLSKDELINLINYPDDNSNTPLLYAKAVMKK